MIIKKFLEKGIWEVDKKWIRKGEKIEKRWKRERSKKMRCLNFLKNGLDERGVKEWREMEMKGRSK